MRNLQTKVFPGGIYNKYNVIVMRTGNANVTYNDLRTGQTGTSGTGLPGGYGKQDGFYDPDGVIIRTSGEQPTERNRSAYTKDSDV